MIILSYLDQSTEHHLIQKKTPNNFINNRKKPPNIHDPITTTIL